MEKERPSSLVVHGSSSDGVGGDDKDKSFETEFEEVFVA
jgi:hypothetical protein